MSPPHEHVPLVREWCISGGCRLRYWLKSTWEVSKGLEHLRLALNMVNLVLLVLRNTATLLYLLLVGASIGVTVASEEVVGSGLRIIGKENGSHKEL